jgi:hypothetical protein
MQAGPSCTHAWRAGGLEMMGNCCCTQVLEQLQQEFKPDRSSIEWLSQGYEEDERPAHRVSPPHPSPLRKASLTMSVDPNGQRPLQPAPCSSPRVMDHRVGWVDHEDNTDAYASGHPGRANGSVEWLSQGYEEDRTDAAAPEAEAVAQTLEISYVSTDTT